MKFNGRKIDSFPYTEKISSLLSRQIFQEFHRLRHKYSVHYGKRQNQTWKSPENKRSIPRFPISIPSPKQYKSETWYSSPRSLTLNRTIMQPTLRDLYLSSACSSFVFTGIYQRLRIFDGAWPRFTESIGQVDLIKRVQRGRKNRLEPASILQGDTLILIALKCIRIVFHQRVNQLAIRLEEASLPAFVQIQFYSNLFIE